MYTHIHIYIYIYIYMYIREREREREIVRASRTRLESESVIIKCEFPDSCTETCTFFFYVSTLFIEAQPSKFPRTFIDADGYLDACFSYVPCS